MASSGYNENNSQVTSSNDKSISRKHISEHEETIKSDQMASSKKLSDSNDEEVRVRSVNVKEKVTWKKFYIFENKDTPEYDKAITWATQFSQSAAQILKRSWILHEIAHFSASSENDTTEHFFAILFFLLIFFCVCRKEGKAAAKKSPHIEFILFLSSPCLFLLSLNFSLNLFTFNKTH